MRKIISLYLGVVFIIPTVVLAQSEGRASALPQRPPIIDVHRHTGSIADLPATLAEMDNLGIVLSLVNGPPDASAALAAAAPKRILAGVLFPCPAGNVPLGGPKCFADGAEFPAISYLRTAFASGRLHFLGEVTAQYFGISPADQRMKPYYALAEELDIPVAIHLGLAPPSTPYECCPGFRAALGHPLQLEEVLIKHPKLRVWVMHAGYPYLEEMKALMLVYPQVHVDIAAINLPFILPRVEFHDYLHGLMRAGLGKRILFGSDYSPIRTAIEAIETADFLTDEQKRDILYSNAVRFLKLDGEPRAPKRTAAQQGAPPERPHAGVR